MMRESEFFKALFGLIDFLEINWEGIFVALKNFFNSINAKR